MSYISEVSVHSSSAPSVPPAFDSTTLYAVIAILVFSNFWTLTLVAKPHTARITAEEREKWV
ncbi:hypothetical protein EDB83DRAFT_2517864 [Lactarius deliciosus]|nr:hypothetical protein EDB83DRAFT_2517864 [Lactarius deliciosus]